MRDTSHVPPFAAWRHHDARDGFEVVFFDQRRGGRRVSGHTAAVEDGEAFAVRYTIELDEAWRTRCARVSGQSARGARAITLEGDGHGSWCVEGPAAPHLEGCLDVDLESSSLTNAFPVRRLRLPPGGRAPAPAVYVRALTLDVERLEQHYLRLDDHADQQRYEYTAPSFDFRCELMYDHDGLVLEYPGIATRMGG
jgi:hypothetical protein